MTPTIGLSAYRWNNNIKSTLLLAAFPFLLLLFLSVLVYVMMLFISSQEGIAPDDFLTWNVTPVLGTYGPLDFTLGVARSIGPYVIGAALLWLAIGYLCNDFMIHRATGAKAVTHAEQPRLYGILETLCISRGMAMPKLYIIDTDAMNAYASGIDTRSYAVTVTRGLLDTLNDAELEAVLGHELTHIRNRDTRLLIVTILFVGIISFVAQLCWRGMLVSSSDRRGSDAMGLVVALVGAVAYVLALVLRFAISRRREYLADEGSVELTKRPEALISALRKISGNPDVPHVPSEVRQMFIENPMHESAFLNLFATHPPIEDRIRVLEQMEGGAPLPFDSSPPQSHAHHAAGSVPESGSVAQPPHQHGSVPDSGKSR
ncbi:MAG TPA: M48 family metallopeptidase [Stellaceae bacterium]|nr:M48 family metallopeptidase [Stellaceae bacterium]